MTNNEKINELGIKALECMKNQEFEQALEIIEEIIYSGDTNIILYALKADIFSKLGRSEDALDCFNEIIKLDPNHRDAYFNKGNIFAESNQNDEAIKAYDIAITIDPNDSDAHTNKGAALNGLQKYKEALKCLDTAIKLNSKNIYAYVNKAVALESLGGNEEALGSLNSAIRLGYNDSTAYNSKGALLGNLARYDEALKCFNIAIELEPKNSIAYFNKGNVLQLLDRYEDALISYEKSINFNPHNSKAYNNKGAILQILNNNDEASKAYNKAIQINSKDSNAYFNKIRVLIDLRKTTTTKEKLFTVVKKEVNETLFALIKNADNILYQFYFMLIVLYEKKYIEKGELSSILQNIITKQPNDNMESKTLYSYVPFNKETIDSIVHEYKYAQQIFNFNDPTDPTIRLIKTDDNQKQMKSMFEDIRIACFSTDHLNMLLYSHYTNSHEGICIEYDFTNFNKDKQVLLKMDYKNGIKIDENTLQIIALLSTNDKKQITSFLDLFRTKQTCWEYEKEYRVITYGVDKIKLPIKAIYFGKEMSDHDINLIKALFTNKNSNINFWKVQVAKDNLFRLYAVGDILPIPIFPEKISIPKND